MAAVSVQDLRPSSQDTSAFYLANIYQLLADPNVSRASILATPAQPPPFSPPKYAIWVNSFWFLSLVMSLTCALLATMLQQWSRQYVTNTQPPRYSPHERAPIRAFFAHGVEKFHLPSSVEVLPTLLHLSLFLFFSGLAIYLFNINHTVFSVVVWWVGLAGAIYGCITVMPIFRHDSPYYAPLSSSTWLFYNGILYVFLQICGLLRRLFSFIRDCLCPPRNLYFRSTSPDDTEKKIADRRKSLRGMRKTIQETGSELGLWIARRILTWTIHSLHEDTDIEQFFETIPGLYSSPAVGASTQPVFAELHMTLEEAVTGFLHRTLTSNSVIEVKTRRVISCAKAVDIIGLSDATTMSILEDVFEYGVDVLRSVEIGRSLRSSGDGLCAPGIIAGFIANVQERERDYRWIALAKRQLGVSEEKLRDYLAHGDSVLLANLTHITRLLFRACLKDIKGMTFCLYYILPLISNFDIRHALPGLQHDFCDLWNEITRKAQNDLTFCIALHILRPIRHLYIALHQGTDAAPTAFNASTSDDAIVLLSGSSYPLCNIPGHHPVSATGENAHSPTDTSPTHPPCNTPSSLTAEHVAEELSLHHAVDATPTVELFPCTPQPPVDAENSHSAAISFDIITQDPTDTPYTLFATSNSESDPLPASTAFTPTPHPPSSNTIDTPLSSFPAPVSSDTLPENPQSSLASPECLIDQAIAVPGLLPSTSATAIALTSSQQGTSVSYPSDIDRATELSNNVEVPQPSAMSAPDIDTASFSRDVDCPE